jgi:hypothetical protein
MGFHHIPQPHNPPPGHLWIATAHGGRDLFGGFTEQLEVPQRRIGDGFIVRELLRAQSMSKMDHLGAVTFRKGVTPGLPIRRP